MFECVLIRETLNAKDAKYEDAEGAKKQHLCVFLLCAICV